MTMQTTKPIKSGVVMRKCKRCGIVFPAKKADVKRGWGKFCNKSCKAIKQTYGSDAWKN